MASGSEPCGNRTVLRGGWWNLLALVTILVAITGGVSPDASAGLSPQVVDTSHTTGGGTSIAVQPTGQVHVAYQGATPNVVMKYATNAYGLTASAWATIQPVSKSLDGFELKCSGLAVDGAGNVHICYYDTYRRQVMYTNNAADGNWAVPVLIDGGGMPHSAIAVDSENRAHILMVNDAGQARYFTASFPAVLSAPETLDTDCSGRVQIVIDADNHAHALYTVRGSMRYATNASGSWQKDTSIDPSVTADPQAALCVDDNGHAHTAYVSGTVLRYATNAGLGWEAEDVKTNLIDGDTIAVHVMVDASGTPTIDWFSAASGEVTRIRKNSSDWVSVWSFDVPSAADAVDASIVAVADKVHLVFTETDTNRLLHATNDPAGPQGADVQVTQTRSPDSVVSNQEVTYTIQAKNLGIDAATDVVVENELPVASKSVSTTHGTYSENPDTHKITWNIGSLARDEVAEMTVTVTAPFRGTLSNRATVTSALGEDFRTANNISDDSSTPLEIVPLEHPLVLSVHGGLGGTLTTEQPLQSKYDEGARVTVVATPDPGYRVQGWSGTVDDASKSNTNVVEIGPGEQTVVQVRFEKIPRQLIVVAGGNGSVSPLSAVRPHGEVVTLTATPAPHYKVKKWTGTDNDNRTGNVNFVTMDADRSVIVEFEPAPNGAPKAMAIMSSVACPGDTVILDGTPSYDPDDDPLTYKWEANDVTLNDSTSAQASFTAPHVDEELIVEISLTVNDGQYADTQIYVMKIQPTGIPTRGCGGGAVNPSGLVCMYSLCWVGLACMKWGAGIGRRRGRQ